MSRQRMVIATVLIAWLIVLAIIVQTSLDRLEAPAWGNPIGGQASIEIAGNARVGQQFTAPLPGLYRIELVLNEANASGLRPIIFHLRSISSSKVISSSQMAASEAVSLGPSAEAVESPVGFAGQTITFEAGNAEGPALRAVQFPPLPTTKGQILYFYLESPDSTAGDAVRVEYNAGALLEGARAYANDEPLSGNLQFQTFYSPRTRDKIGLLLSQLTSGRPYWLGTRAFYAGLASVYGLLTIVLLWQATRTVAQEGKGGPAPQTSPTCPAECIIIEGDIIIADGRFRSGGDLTRAGCAGQDPATEERPG